MQRRRLLRLFKDHGWYLLRNGSNHDVWTNGKEQEPIPRHREINERLAKSIIAKYKLK